MPFLSIISSMYTV